MKFSDLRAALRVERRWKEAESAMVREANRLLESGEKKTRASAVIGSQKWLVEVWGPTVRVESWKLGNAAVNVKRGEVAARATMAGVPREVLDALPQHGDMQANYEWVARYLRSDSVDYTTAPTSEAACMMYTYRAGGHAAQQKFFELYAKVRTADGQKGDQSALRNKKEDDLIAAHLDFHQRKVA